MGDSLAVSVSGRVVIIISKTCKIFYSFEDLEDLPTWITCDIGILSSEMVESIIIGLFLLISTLCK